MKREVAIHWDQNSEERNPIRDEQLTILVSAVQATFTGGHCLLDLGYGSGKVEERLFQEVPSIRVLGVDKSAAMMELAEARLKPVDLPDHQQRLANRGDYPVSLQSHLEWLTQVGFEVASLHLHTHRALLAAVKRSHGGAR